MLEGYGLNVRRAEGGQEALEQIAAHPPDVVLLDVMMPDMSGLDVLERLRSSPTTARLPVILVTANGDDDQVMAGYQGGADYYVTKPFTTRQLVHGIALVLGETDLAARPPGVAA
jgi:CheY-like chemotaxis protein